MKALRYICALAGLVLTISCGTTVKVADTPAQLPLPGAAEAATLVSELAGAPTTAVTLPFATAAGPKVFSFYPDENSNNMNVVTLAPRDGQWELENRVGYPCFEADGTAFKEFSGDPSVERIGDSDFIVLKALREDGAGKAQRTVMTFDPEKESFQAVSFCGKYLADGKIEGTSYVDVVASAINPEIEFARGLLAADETLVELSRADEMTDQAIAWWLKNNPRAATSATNITYGAIDTESSLVEAYKKAKKETSSAYNAALFNIRGYTVIVIQRKSNGSYVLAWAEPVCANKNTDPLLNNIFFRNDSNLTLFYYKGNKTYNYQLNLATGRLMR